MINVYQQLRNQAYFKKLQCGELMIAKYDCPIRDERATVWSESDYLVYVLGGHKTWHLPSGSFELKAGDAALIKRGASMVEQFFDEHAHRLSIVLHGVARALADTVRELLAHEAPAHLQWQLLETDHPFVLGLSPLLGIHSWLQTQPPTDPVVLEQTELGRGALLQNPVALSPHHAAPPTSNRGAS